MKTILLGLGSIGLWALSRELAHHVEQHIVAGESYAVAGALHVMAAGGAVVLAYIAIKPHIATIVYNRRYAA